MGALEISPLALREFLEERGFRATRQGQEVVYVLAHHVRPELKLKVYTSLDVRDGLPRPTGKDAIFVTLAWEGPEIVPWPGAPPSKSVGLWKARRLHRTGELSALLSRLYDRMREGYEFANKWLQKRWSDLPPATK